MLGSKHFATFLLGAAAGLAAYKYLTMTEEEKEELAAKLKEKANLLQEHVLEADEKGVEYFNELKAKGTEVLREHWPKVEEFFNNLFSEEVKAETNTTEATA